MVNSDELVTEGLRQSKAQRLLGRGVVSKVRCHAVQFGSAALNRDIHNKPKDGRYPRIEFNFLIMFLL